MIEEFLSNPAEMTNRELENEYRALTHPKLVELFEDKTVSEELKEYFRWHAMNVELEYIIRNS